ncbi:DUF2972 domain-containing protein [Campylobacter lari]|nr:DUF2972 domain-containing protein [Campylobacter lari]EGK8091895.1 DUF2972 domain-containing protein [Campylobacter lari]
MLGEALIKAHKTWYKGEYFKLPSLLKEKYKIYKNIQDIINILPQELHYHFYNLTIKNHKINIQDLIYILKQHKDYKPILENIFHNFDFFIKHFDLINTWLLSNDFKEKYKQENHPYPSLLDPRKLNDDNEKVNYKNIPADLAWDMNLPLPKNKIVYIGYGLSGNTAMLFYLSRYNKITTNYMYSYTDNCIFNINYQFNKDIAINYKKIHMLYENNTIILVRDPIERIKHAVNHGYWRNFNQKDFDCISINDDLDKVFDRIRYVKKHNMESNYIEWSDKPTLDVIDSILNNNCFRYNSVFHTTNMNINYIDMKQIIGNCTYQTLEKLADDFGLNYPSYMDKNVINKKQINIFRYLLPLTLKIENVEIFIMGSNIHIPPKCKIINYLLLKRNNPLYNLLYIVTEKDIDNNMIDILKKYMFNFTAILENKIRILQSNLVSEKDCIIYLKENKELGDKLKKILDNELIHIKKHRPDLVSSWKYYQEFENIYKIKEY